MIKEQLFIHNKAKLLPLRSFAFIHFKLKIGLRNLLEFALLAAPLPYSSMVPKSTDP